MLKHCLICAALFFLPVSAFAQPLPAEAIKLEPSALSIDDVQSIIMKRNRSVLRASAEVAKCESALKAVQATQYPTLAFFGFEGFQTAGGHRNNLAVLPGVFQPVTQLYRIRMQVEQAKISLKIAREQLRLAKQSSVAEAKQTYLRMIALQSAVASRKENLEFLNSLVAYVSAEVKREAVLRVDLMGVQAREAQAEYELERDSDELITAGQNLNRFLDRPLQTTITVLEQPVIPAQYKPAETAMTQAVLRRPEVAALQLNANRFHLEEKITLSRYIPDISLGGTSIFSRGFDVTFPRQFLSFGALGVWEPWDWGRRREQARVAARQRDQLRIELSDTSDKVSVEADNARRSLKVREKEIRAAELLQSSSFEQLRIARRRFGVGAALLKDVLEAQTSYANAIAQSVKAKTDYANAIVEYDRAVGRDFD